LRHLTHLLGKRRLVNYDLVKASSSATATVKIGGEEVVGYDGKSSRRRTTKLASKSRCARR